MKSNGTLDIADLAAEVHRRSEGRPRVLVGVDGPGASGKSTLAGLLANAMPDTAVVHVDDFYLPNKQQGSRAGQVAPHFDWPRLAQQVVVPGATGGPLRYQRYDWDSDTLAEWIEVGPGVPVIVEGVYCLERQLRADYTYKVFCRAERAIRLRRGLDRDGEQARGMWVDEWMPAEDAYAERDRPEDAADLVVDSSVGPGNAPAFHIVRCRT